MSTIQEKLAELENDIRSAYQSVEEKQGELPEDKNTNNLAAAIASIPAGGPARKLPNASLLCYGFNSSSAIYGITGVIVKGTGEQQYGFYDGSQSGGMSPSTSSGTFNHMYGYPVSVFDPETGEIIKEWQSFPLGSQLAEGEYFPISKVQCWPCTSTGIITGEPEDLYLGGVNGKYTAMGTASSYYLDCFVKPNGELKVFTKDNYYLLTLSRLGFLRPDVIGSIGSSQPCCFTRNTDIQFSKHGMEYVGVIGPYKISTAGENAYDLDRINYMSQLNDWCSGGFPLISSYKAFYNYPGGQIADGYNGLGGHPASAAGQLLKIGQPVVLPESVITYLKAVPASSKMCLLQFGANCWHFKTAEDEGVTISQWRGGAQLITNDNQAESGSRPTFRLDANVLFY